MKKFLISVVAIFLLSACAQDPYHLDINNYMSGAHGQSVYYRSNMRTAYAGQIRRVLSNKFKEMGIKPATSAEIADYIAIFDIETFYKQSNEKFNPAAFENTEILLFCSVMPMMTRVWDFPAMPIWRLIMIKPVLL